METTVNNLTNISIHALREESDAGQHVALAFAVQISIHALREESDWTVSMPLASAMEFQSTLSVRRATGRYGV